MRRSIFLFALLLVGLIGAMAAKSRLIEPPPLRYHNDGGQFVADRAAARLADILGNQRPHPSDTTADDAVRARLVAQLQGMGLKPIVRDQVACNELYKARGVSCAHVRNVIAILGPATGKAVLLNAHYDSTPVGPAAADDGIGVATLLEVGSILKDEPLKRPVILLFNEGEELGLVGARAFLADPLSRNVDGLVNLEARGVNGPANMFETSRPNASAIALYAKTAAHPVANSLSTDVYRLMPNYTDVNSFSERGWLTLNIAPIGNETRYHSPGDDLAALDHRTLQHMGDQTLALAASMANGTSGVSGGDRMFMDVAGRALISLPLALGVGLLVVLLVAFGFLWWRAGHFGLDLALVAVVLVLSGVLAWIALDVVGAVRHGMFWRAHPVWTLLAVYATMIFVAAAFVRRDDRLHRLRIAFWLIFLLIGGAIGIAAPGGIIFFLFPPLIVLCGIVAARWWRPSEQAASIAAILFLYVTWGAMLALLEELLNGGPMWLFAPLGGLLILPAMIEAAPLISKVPARLATTMTGLLAVAGWTAAAAAPAYSADRQQKFVIEHITDVAKKRSYWSIVNDRAPLPAAFRQFGKWEWAKLPHSDRMRWLAAAPPLPNVKPPTVEPVAQPIAVVKGKPRTLSVVLHTNGASSIGLIAPDGADIRSAGVAGFIRPIDQSAKGEKYYFQCFGRSCDGLNLQINVANSDAIEFTLVGATPALPPSAKPLVDARPRFARPQYAPDETVTISKVWL
jgi:hypothetical protein